MKATSIRLTDKRESVLTETAKRLKCFSAAGNPSWRVMLQMLADGFLTISNPQDKTRQIFINFKRPPGWWNPDEKESMPAAEVAKKYKTTVEILEEKGFVVDGDRIYAGNWKGWRTAVETKKEKSTSNPSPDPSPIFAANLERAAMPRPDWFRLSPTGRALMPIPDAESASGESVDEMVANGYRIITHNGQKFLTAPAGAEWDCDGQNAIGEARTDTAAQDSAPKSNSPAVSG